MILDLSKEPHSRGMMGSPGFVAPEVILGQHHTSQMDCYSLGVLLFVMLVGAKPMTQDQARSMQYALMTPESLRGMHVRRWLLVFVWLRACGCFQLSVWCPMQYALVTPESVRGMHKRSCLPSLLAAGVGLCCLPWLLACMQAGSLLHVPVYCRRVMLQQLLWSLSFAPWRRRCKGQGRPHARHLGEQRMRPKQPLLHCPHEQ